MNQYYVYMLTNHSRTIYTGITKNLQRRVYEHKQKLIEGFTKKYNMTILVYYEETSDVQSAIKREKQIKGWLRSKKVSLIESMNPQWKDLSEGWYDVPSAPSLGSADSSSASGGLRMTYGEGLNSTQPRRRRRGG